MRQTFNAHLAQVGARRNLHSGRLSDRQGFLWSIPATKLNFYENQGIPIHRDQVNLPTADGVLARDERESLPEQVVCRSLLGVRSY